MNISANLKQKQINAAVDQAVIDAKNDPSLVINSIEIEMIDRIFREYCLIQSDCVFNGHPPADMLDAFVNVVTACLIHTARDVSKDGEVRRTVYSFFISKLIDRFEYDNDEKDA